MWIFVGQDVRGGVCGGVWVCMRLEVCGSGMWVYVGLVICGVLWVFFGGGLVICAGVSVCVGVDMCGGVWVCVGLELCGGYGWVCVRQEVCVSNCDAEVVWEAWVVMWEACDVWYVCVGMRRERCV